MTNKKRKPRRNEDNGKLTLQEISNDYRNQVAAEAKAGMSFSGDSKFAVSNLVEHHPYSYLAAVREEGFKVLPACRPTSNWGQYIQVGPEVRKLFCDAGAEYAYVVLTRLLEIDLMYPLKIDNIYRLGAHPIKVKQLKDDFPHRSEDWIRERLTEIKKIIGMHVEPRRNDLTGEQLGNAHYPAMLYFPDDRIYLDVSSEIQSVNELIQSALKLPRGYYGIREEEVDA